MLDPNHETRRKRRADCLTNDKNDLMRVCNHVLPNGHALYTRSKIVGWRPKIEVTPKRRSLRTSAWSGLDLEFAKMGHIHLRGKWRPRTPRWYNAALTHTKWMGNLSSPTLNSNCENRRACFCQTSPGMHVWGVLVPIRTVFMRSNRPRG